MSSPQHQPRRPQPRFEAHYWDLLISSTVGPVMLAVMIHTRRKLQAKVPSR
jgi:hypothetical protein